MTDIKHKLKLLSGAFSKALNGADSIDNLPLLLAISHLDTDVMAGGRASTYAYEVTLR